MTALVLVSVIGTLILLLSFRLLAQSRNQGHSRIVTLEDYVRAQEALDSIFIETAAISRIFSTEDADFIVRSATADVQCLFFKERKRLALEWIRKTQRRMARLMDLHLRLASYTDDPNPGFELMLTGRYFVFIIVSNVARSLLWLLGLSRARHTFSYTIRNTAKFCDIFRLRIERVNRAGLSPGRESLIH